MHKTTAKLLKRVETSIVLIIFIGDLYLWRLFSNHSLHLNQLSGSYILVSEFIQQNWSSECSLTIRTSAGSNIEYDQRHDSNRHPLMSSKIKVRFKGILRSRDDLLVREYVGDVYLRKWEMTIDWSIGHQFENLKKNIYSRIGRRFENLKKRT